MPRKKILEEEPADEELTETIKEKVFTTTAKEEPKPEVKKPSDTVKVKVLVGTLKWEAGTFEKNEVFECSRQQALRFGGSVEILK